jgi:hypothetical protein
MWYLIFIILLLLYIFYKFKKFDQIINNFPINDIEKNLESNNYYFQNSDFDQMHYNHEVFHSKQYNNDYNPSFYNFQNLNDIYKISTFNLTNIRKRGRAGSPIKNEN